MNTQKQKQWLSGLVATFVVGGLLSLTAALPAQAATVNVNSGGQQGWLFQADACSATSLTGAQAFEVGPGTTPLGVGSLEQRVGLNGNSRQALGQMNWNGVRLENITDLRYATFIETPGQGSQAPYVILNIDHNNDGIVDDQLVFEPAFQNSSLTGLPMQGSVMSGIWQEWNARTGGWWSANGIAGATAGVGVKSIGAYLSAQPNSRIINNGQNSTGALRLASGCGAPWANFVGNVDNITLGQAVFSSGATTTALTTYDFEPAPGAFVPVACSPKAITTLVGQPVTLTGSGGNGTYTWSSADLIITDPNGAQFTVTYGTPTVSLVTVTSAGQSDSCAVTVLAAAGTGDDLPGIPNTGAGGGVREMLPLILLALLAGILGGSYLWTIRRTA